MLLLWTAALESARYSCVDFKARKKITLKMIYYVLFYAGPKKFHSVILALKPWEHRSCLLFLCYNAFLEHLRLFPCLTEMLPNSSFLPDFSKAVVSTVMMSMVINTFADRNVSNLKQTQ